jgi:hypothetical protein
MDRLMFRRAQWALHVAWVRHGVTGAAALLALVVAMALLGMIGNDYRRVIALERELSVKTNASLLRRPAGETKDPIAEAPAFPSEAARSRTNGKILAILDRLETGPEQVRFKFEALPEAGLLRQVAVFNIRTTWPQVADVLGELQEADRAVFISRLKVAREGAEEDVVEAEIQLGMVTHAAPLGGAKP